MQGAVTQSFAKRYTPKTVAAIEALLSPTPDLAAIRAGIRALGFDDLRGISDGLDSAIATAESDPRFRPWSAAGESGQLTTPTRGTLADLMPDPFEQESAHAARDDGAPKKL